MSVADQVRDYIERHPIVEDAMREGIVNFSALTRQIMDDTGIQREDAVLAACRRYEPRDQGTAMRAALRDARLEVRTGVGMLSFEPSWRLLESITLRMKAIVSDEERIHLLHGWEAIEVVAVEHVLDDVAKNLGEEPIEARGGLAEINVKTKEVLDDVPGFIAHAAKSLAARGIPIVDATTCRRDHVFLIDEEHLAAAVDALMS